MCSANWGFSLIVEIGERKLCTDLTAEGFTKRKKEMGLKHREKQRGWIPAFAGMTGEKKRMTGKKGRSASACTEGACTGMDEMYINNKTLNKDLVVGSSHEFVCNDLADGRKELCVSILGNWELKKMAVTAERHQEMLANFEAEGKPLLFDYDHASVFEGHSKAAGWGTNMRIEGDKLMVTFSGTEEGQKAIANRDYLFLSPVYQHTRYDGVTGKKISNNWRLHSVALTNTPFITELPQIQANKDDVTGGNMDPEVLNQLMKLLGVNSEAEVHAKLAEMQELKANIATLTTQHQEVMALLNAQTVDMAIANKQLLPAHKEHALTLINTDKKLYDASVSLIANNVANLTQERELKPGAEGDKPKDFSELLENSAKAKDLFVNNRGLFDSMFADHVKPQGSNMDVNTTAGFGQKLFVAKVHDIEVMKKAAEREILDTIHDRSAELKGSEDTLSVPRITPGNVVAMPATAETFINGSTEDMLEIAISDAKGYPIIVTTSEQLETNIPLRNTRAEVGAIAHRKYRNGYLLKAIANAAAAGNRKEFSDTTDNVISDEDILNAATILDNAEAPSEDRFMVIGATMHQAIASNPNFVSRDKMGDAGKLLPMNVIGMLRGFEVVKMPDARLPLLHATTGASATTGQKCVLFYQKYALAYGAHVYQLLGPTLDVTIPAEKFNLFRKQGCAGQNTEFIVSYREND